MGLSELIPHLRNVPLFRDLTDEELERIASIAILRSFPKKTVIFTEGSARGRLLHRRRPRENG